MQFNDINGDGTNEALAFFNVPGERPLKIYVFEKVDDSYRNAAVIDGDGTAIKNITISIWTATAGWKLP